MVLDLRAAGLSEQEIADQMTANGEKITKQGVSKVIRNAMQQMREADQRDVDEIRQLDLYRIDQALKVLWPKVKEGNLKAMREYRAFIDQRSRLLGTYAAVKHEVGGQIDHLLQANEREEIARLEEAFASSSADFTLDEESIHELPAPETLPPAS